MSCFQNYSLYQAQHHRCRKKEVLAFSDKGTVKTDDTLIYHDNTFYRIRDIDEPDLIVQRIRTSRLDTSDIVRLPWQKVGVAKYDGPRYDRDMIRINKEDVRAKAIICGKVISSMPPEWVVTWSFFKTDFFQWNHGSFILLRRRWTRSDTLMIRVRIQMSIFLKKISSHYGSSWSHSRLMAQWRDPAKSAHSAFVSAKWAKCSSAHSTDHLWLIRGS